MLISSKNRNQIINMNEANMLHPYHSGYSYFMNAFPQLERRSEDIQRLETSRILTMMIEQKAEKNRRTEKMTNQEAIEILKKWASEYRQALNEQDYLRKYQNESRREIESLEMAVAALEKQAPMEPDKNYHDDGLTIRYFCPKCKRYLGQRGKHNVIMFNKEVFCQNSECGQAINWEGETHD